MPVQETSTLVEGQPQVQITLTPEEAVQLRDVLGVQVTMTTEEASVQLYKLYVELDDYVELQAELDELNMCTHCGHTLEQHVSIDTCEACTNEARDESEICHDFDC
jgi:hypothetical protein